MYFIVHFACDRNQKVYAPISWTGKKCDKQSYTDPNLPPEGLAASLLSNVLYHKIIIAMRPASGNKLNAVHINCIKLELSAS